MKNKMGRYVACIEERISVYKVLVEKPEGKRPHGRPTCRWEGITKMVLQDIGWGSMDWIDLAQYRDRLLGLMNTVMNYFRCYTVHVVKLLNYYTNYCTYIKFTH